MHGIGDPRAAPRGGAHTAHPDRACDPAECADAITRARNFLLAQQRADGAWPGFWGINFIYATGLAVAALRDAGLSAEHTAVRRAVDWLHSVQHAGWRMGRTPLRLPDRQLRGKRRQSGHHDKLGRSGSAARHEFCDARCPARAGLALRHQLPDGDWPRDCVNGVFFGTAMLDYRLYNTYFPTWALNVADAMTR